MDDAIHLPGEYCISCADFSVRAEVAAAALDEDIPMMGRVNINAKGPQSNGAINLASNGRIAAVVDQSKIDIVSDGIVVDGGDIGNIGLRTGTAPMMQSIDLEGNGGSIVLGNGQLPISPKIEVNADSIVLSVGTSKITISATGIEISGLNVDVKGTVAVDVKGGASATLEASGNTAIKGAMVMIN